MSGTIKRIEDADVTGKRVLVRLDLNVPMNASGQITDTTRIDRVIPGLKALTDRGARVIVLSHYGRPKGKVVRDMSLQRVADGLSEALGKPVRFSNATVGDDAQVELLQMSDGEVAMVENLRFHAGETENAPEFADALSELGDIYVNDAFSCSHRAHASTEGLAHKLPAYVGPAMAAEVEALERVLETPERPVAAVVGGAKVSTKLSVLNTLIQKMDVVIVGGGMANTFLLAQGKSVGASLCEPDLVEEAKSIMAAADAAGCKLMLPVDGVVAEKFEAGAANEVVSVDDVPENKMILDVGPASIKELVAEVGNLKTLLWNGPLGAFEIDPFGKGTFAVAQAAAAATNAGNLTTVAGGGDTVAALNAAGVGDHFTYVSTAGGAFLEWLEGKELPGVAALRG